MKKTLVLVLLVLVLCGGVAAADAVVKGGLDFLNDRKLEGTSVGGEDIAFSVAAEYLYSVFKFLDVGAGAEYQIRENMSYLPVYGVIRLPIDIAFFAPYATGRIGYGFLIQIDQPPEVTLVGGLHWAAGGGILIKRLFLIEALWCYYSGVRKINVFGTIYDFKEEYTKLSVYAGLNFKF